MILQNTQTLVCEGNYVLQEWYCPVLTKFAALQWHYRILQAMALGEDIPDMPEDKTVPKYRQIDKVWLRFKSGTFPLARLSLHTLQRAGSYVMDWGRELEAQISAWEHGNQSAATTASTKRSIVADTDNPGRGAKRAKMVDLDDGMSDEAMKKSFDRNEIGKVRIASQNDEYKRYIGTQGNMLMRR